MWRFSERRANTINAQKGEKGTHINLTIKVTYFSYEKLAKILSNAPLTEKGAMLCQRGQRKNVKWLQVSFNFQTTHYHFRLIAFLSHHGFQTNQYHFRSIAFLSHHGLQTGQYCFRLITGLKVFNLDASSTLA